MEYTNGGISAEGHPRNGGQRAKGGGNERQEGVRQAMSTMLEVQAQQDVSDADTRPVSADMPSVLGHGERRGGK